MLFTFFGYCQSTKDKIDSLEVLLKQASNDSIYIKYSQEIGVHINHIDTEKAIKHFKESLRLLDSNYTYSNKNELKTIAYNYLTSLERRKNNYDTALGYSLKALKITKQLKDSLKIGKSYHDISKLFSAKREYDNAIIYMKLALPLRKKDSIGYGTTLRNYGKLLYIKRDYQKASKLLDSALLFLQKSPLYVADVNTIYSKIYRSGGQLDAALKILNENVKIYSEYEKPERKANIFIDMAIVYRKLNKYPLALRYLDSAETFHRQFNNKKVISNIYLERYTIYNKQRKHKLALQNYITYKKYNDSVFNTAKIKKVAHLEFKYQQEKEDIINQLNYEANKKNLLTVAKSQRFQKVFYAVLFIFSLLIIITLVINYKYKQKVQLEKIKKNALESELLNEKMVFLQYKINRLLADNKMRGDFKNELVLKLHNLKTEVTNRNLIGKYKSLIIQIENQTKTEKRLDTTTKKEIDSHKNSNFELKLIKKFPQLTKSEREICLLFHLNLSIKEIMNIRNVTGPAIKSARYRIRKKIAVPKGTELEFYIQNLLN